MLHFFIFSSIIVLINSIYSLRNYSKFNNAYRKLGSWNFSKFGKLHIANNDTNEEFVIISDWNYRISSTHNLQFDIWALFDIHQMFWLIKFNNKIKNLTKKKPI